MSAPHGHAAKILALAGELKELADKIERETAASIVEAGEWTRSAVAGLPCSAEVRWNTPDVSTHDVAPPDDGFAIHDDPPSRPL